MAETTEKTAVTTGKKGPGRPSKLTAEEMIVIARLTAAGRSARSIARLLTTPERSISGVAVAQWQRRAKQPAEEIRMALAAHRMDAVEDWVKASSRGARDGRHAPAKDLLTATGAIAPDARERLIIIVGNGAADLGTLPMLPERPILDVTPSTPSLPALPERIPQPVVADI